jgi:hypothetical protein
MRSEASDIIVSISPDFVLAIGRECNESVSITRYEKTASGFLLQEMRSFMHMVNQA